MADSVLFEQNTEATRQSFLQEATPYLENLVQKQGLYAFRIVMDDSNNTPDVIDNNQLVGQVFLQPTKTAEFVVIDFVLTRTGASFTD
jgi:phage tail sheath protein FI